MYKLLKFPRKVYLSDCSVLKAKLMYSLKRQNENKQTVLSAALVSGAQGDQETAFQADLSTALSCREQVPPSECNTPKPVIPLSTAQKVQYDKVYTRRLGNMLQTEEVIPQASLPTPVAENGKPLL